MQSKNRVTDVENKFLVTKGGMESEINWEIGLMYILHYVLKKLLPRIYHIEQGTLLSAPW